RRHARERAHEAGEMTSTVSERLAAVKLIRTYAGEERERARFEDQADRYRRRVERTQRFAALTGPVSEVFAGLLLVLLIGAGASSSFMAGTISPQALLVFIAAALRVMTPLKSLSQFPVQMAIGLTGAERVFEVLDRPAAEPARDEGSEATFERTVTFDQVGFEYPGPSPGRAAGFALRGISFTLSKGAVVALVGPSGGGKTTLAELLPRLREPTEGRILLDGVPMSALSRASVRALMGFVGQETVLFNDTVHANIAYGLPSASEAAVEAAARAANAHEFIAALPEGYQTRLGERGTRLSGGQRQRIAIARALLRDPPILVLDEATSALDTESERLVQEALNRLMQDRTVLVIAHRLATVRHADLILVVEGGRIVERGSHAELLGAGGLYARLCRPQAEWLEDAETSRLAARA
ncbi:MAG: ABC transporter ATP-binding protein/permease, partial [Gemmatimonadota bacterium]|nr:ABC transporter ATP-binding protein/permease [Gemmatimonadota bacterium]